MMSIGSRAALALTILLAGAASPPVAAHSLKRLEDHLRKRETYVQIVQRPAPDFTLRDARGRTHSFSDLRGKVVVLWFVYASCLDVCPLHSEKIAEIQRMVNKTPMKDLVRFITITTDPKRDTPQVLQDYGPAHGLEPANWTFLTDGQERPETTRNLAESYGLKFTPTKDVYQMHGLVTHLIDKSGKLRGRYHGLKFSATNMVVHINALTNDFH